MVFIATFTIKCLLQISKRADAQPFGISTLEIFQKLDVKSFSFSDHVVLPPLGTEQRKEKKRLAIQDESWLITTFNNRYNAKTSHSEIKVGGKTIRHLILDKSAKLRLAQYIKSTVIRLDKDITVAGSVVPGSGPVGDDKRENISVEIGNSLDNLMETMDEVYWLVHHSVAVWDILHSLEMRHHFVTLELQRTLAENVSTEARRHMMKKHTVLETATTAVYFRRRRRTITGTKVGLNRRRRGFPHLKSARLQDRKYAIG
ncbi:hypothetical protein FRB93_011162 [Tulasnella sp. JGI-2019a]|nr:hypothetical protein FRB93_011162 [Tulasnella sp. JGI-2019a]